MVKEWIIDHAWALIIVLIIILAFLGFYLAFQIQTSGGVLGIFDALKQLFAWVGTGA